MTHDRTTTEIETLLRCLTNWKHWAEAKAIRAPFKGDSDKAARMYATASDLAEEARLDSLRAAAVLFECDEFVGELAPVVRVAPGKIAA